MKLAVRHVSAVIILVVSSSISNSRNLCLAGAVQPESLKLEALFPSPDNPPVIFDESIIASPLLDRSQGKPLIIIPASNGVIAALDAETGALDWKIEAPAPQGQQTQLVSTPVMVGDKLIILYQCLEQGARSSHRLAVIDMANKQLDDGYPVLVLHAEKPGADGKSIVKFNPPTAFSHAALKHAVNVENGQGYIYASFGNAGDTQPFHGWMFEIGLYAWKNQGAAQAVSSVLLTTPEADCPVTVEYGTQEMICGGGIWAPAGPQIFPAADSYEILVPTGNGQIDPARHNYANTLMRLKPGLNFDSGCDALKCSNFDPANPDKGCMESCKNLFIPRLADESAPLKPANRECDDKSFWECLAWMDYDLGANAPIKIAMEQGPSVLVQAGKDGGIYLIDADHLGTQYDRLQIADVCGTSTDPCKIPWAGMIVSQPVLSIIDHVPIVVIATFVPDHSHPAGLVALRIVLENGSPKFKRFWQFPGPESAEAVQSFRSHPSLPVLAAAGKNGDPVVWIIDIGNQGTVYGVRVKDGKLMAKKALQGTGRPLAAPLIHGANLYVTSTLPATNKAILEGFKIAIEK